MSAAGLRLGLTPAERETDGKGLAARLVDGLKADRKVGLRLEGDSSRDSVALMSRRFRGLTEPELDGGSGKCGWEDVDMYEEDLEKVLRFGSVIVAANTAGAARGSVETFASELRRNHVAELPCVARSSLW